MKYLSLVILAGLFLCIFIVLPLVNAESLESIGVFENEKDIELFQTCNNCTYCNLTVIKFPNGSNIAANIIMIQDNTYFNYTLNGANTTTVGKYKYCYDCGNAYVRKTGCIEFEVTETGEKVGLSNIIIVIVFLFLAGVFLVLGYSFSKEHWLLKTFFNFCAIGMGILAVNSAKIISSESTNLGTMGTVGLTMMIIIFSIFFLYIFVYTFIEVIKALREKRGVRWSYQ